MQVHELGKPNKKNKRRVGRGGKRGTYSGRGIKGQKARSGRKIRPQARDVIKKIHKRRGRGKNFSASSTAFHKKPLVVNLEDINKISKEHDIITPDVLKNAGLVKFRGGQNKKIKILGKGKLSGKVSFSKDVLMSESVRGMIGK